MMTTTHAAMGLTGACLLVPVSPELATIAGIGAVLGGAFPDIDILFEHRKTLHHPELYPVAALVAGGVALVRPAMYPVAIAAFLGSAALHSLTDVLGGGLGLRPWEQDDDRGIYLHLSKRWLPPRHWVRYDGAPEDLLAAVGFSILPLVFFDGRLEAIVLAGLGISAVYVLVRKRLVDVYEKLA